jgi:hypothetical protein
MDLPKVDQNRVKAFFKFDLMVLPTLIKIMFVLGLLGIFLGGVAWPFMAASGLRVDFRPDAGPIMKSDFSCGTFAVCAVISVITTLLAMIWWRAVCESMIILFKIHEELSGGRAPKAADVPAGGWGGKPAEAPPAADKPAEPPKA